MKSELLFVYGTLKRGFGNHYYLKDAIFLGRGRTKERYAMYELSIPYVVKDERVSHIVGEVYEVGRDTLKRIDMLEGHPFAYKRERVVVVLEDGTEVSAWLYFWEGCKRGNFNESGEYKRL